MNRKPIFDAVRSILHRGFNQDEVAILDHAIDLATSHSPLVPALGSKGIALIKKWEGCAKRLPDGTFTAYPDPGSADGKPWTIGWGTTGADIKQGLVWTQSQCDARLMQDLQRYVQEVTDFLSSAPTTDNQFDALVSFHYNTGAIRTATLGKLHKAGQYTEACAQFGRWIYNDGKVMNGLKKRRAEEAALYAAS